MHEGLAKIKDVPSVIYGKAQFNVETRRVQAANYKHLVVKDGKFAMWDGKKPTA
jgi:branched-chain amino acid transport system substrate-binding protein